MSDSAGAPVIRHTAIAMVRRWFDDEARWLVVSDEQTPGGRLVETQVLEGESPREALIRELAWQLPPHRRNGYLIASGAMLHYEMPSVFVRCSGEEEIQLDVFEVYSVELYGRATVQALDNFPDVQWRDGNDLIHSTEPKHSLPERQRQLIAMAGIFPGE